MRVSENVRRGIRASMHLCRKGQAGLEVVARACGLEGGEEGGRGSSATLPHGICRRQEDKSYKTVFLCQQQEGDQRLPKGWHGLQRHENGG